MASSRPPVILQPKKNNAPATRRAWAGTTLHDDAMRCDVLIASNLIIKYLLARSVIQNGNVRFTLRVYVIQETVLYSK